MLPASGGNYARRGKHFLNVCKSIQFTDSYLQINHFVIVYIDTSMGDVVEPCLTEDFCITCFKCSMPIIVCIITMTMMMQNYFFPLPAFTIRQSSGGGINLRVR